MEFIMKFASRKLLVTLFGIAASFGLDLDPEVQGIIINLIMAYVASQGVVDAVEAYKK